LGLDVRKRFWFEKLTKGARVEVKRETGSAESVCTAAYVVYVVFGCEISIFISEDLSFSSVPSFVKFGDNKQFLFLEAY
jgi:G:T-mismatch repair DNA endonuclease (very short patch repair protein)